MWTLSWNEESEMKTRWCITKSNCNLTANQKYLFRKSVVHQQFPPRTTLEGMAMEWKDRRFNGHRNQGHPPYRTDGVGPFDRLIQLQKSDVVRQRVSVVFWVWNYSFHLEGCFCPVDFGTVIISCVNIINRFAMRENWGLWFFPRRSLHLLQKSTQIRERKPELIDNNNNGLLTEYPRGGASTVKN